MTIATQYSQYGDRCDGAIYTQKTSPRMFTTPKLCMKQQRIYKKAHTKRESTETSGGENTAADLAVLN